MAGVAPFVLVSYDADSGRPWRDQLLLLRFQILAHLTWLLRKSKGLKKSSHAGATSTQVTSSHVSWTESLQRSWRGDVFVVVPQIL